LRVSIAVAAISSKQWGAGGDDMASARRAYNGGLGAEPLVRGPGYARRANSGKITIS